MSFTLDNYVVINMDGRRFTNHFGKVTCATQLYESGTFEEQDYVKNLSLKHRCSSLQELKKHTGESCLRRPSTTNLGTRM